MYPPSPPFPGPAPAPPPVPVAGPPPALAPSAPPVPPDSGITGSGRLGRGRSSGGSSMAMRRSPERSGSGTWGVRATSTEVGVPRDSTKKFTASGAAGPGLPPAGSRPRITSAAITLACTSTASTAPGATPREGSGRRSPGREGRSRAGAGAGGFTVPEVYPDSDVGAQTHVGAQHAAP